MANPKQKTKTNIEIAADFLEANSDASPSGIERALVKLLSKVKVETRHASAGAWAETVGQLREAVNDTAKDRDALRVTVQRQRDEIVTLKEQVERQARRIAKFQADRAGHGTRGR
jgi:hypothetical protein